MPENRQPPWIISYRYQALFAQGDNGGIHRGSPEDTIGIIAVPPWKYVAQHKLDLNNSMREPYPRNGARLPDDILVIYWAVQLPSNTALTAEELDILS